MPDDRIQDEPDERPRSKRPRPTDEEDERPRRRARRDDDEDDDRRRRRIRRDDGDSGMNSLIPYKNPKALISYYCGVFSFIPCIGIILGVTLILLGIMGLNYRKTHETAGGTAHAWVGIGLSTLTLLLHLAAVVFFVVVVNIK